MRYRHRYAMETCCRDFKTDDFNWERGQGKRLDHVQHLRVAIALTAWLALMVGPQGAALPP